MDDERRVDAILDPEPRAWEALLDSSPLLEPIPAVATPGSLGRATEGDSSNAPIYTSVAKAEDVSRARQKLVLLGDALQAPSPLEPNYDMALREEAKERSLSDRWGGWKTHPLWWIHSIMGCPLAEVTRTLEMWSLTLEPAKNVLLFCPWSSKLICSVC